MANHKYFDYSVNDMKLADTMPTYKYSYPLVYIDEKFIKVSDYCPEFSDIYYISNYGRIYNANTGCINATRLNIHGYEYTALAGQGKNGELIMILIHRLVMRCFNPITDHEQFQVNHINGCKTDNRLTNLEWCTAKENMQHCMKNNLAPTCDAHNWATLTNEEVHEICRMLEQKIHPCEIAKILFGDENAHIASILDIKLGHSWKNISCNYNIEKCNYHGSRFTDSQLRMMLDLHKQGKSNRDILIALGFDPFSMTEYDRERVYKIIRRLANGEGYNHIFK